ncbi:MAG TPA: PrpF domain-containing protein [Aliidongia sp.]|nr:PrpF domain-containing protein [Aliidongia sp.]
MGERFIPAVFMRGGSSKGIVVRGRDLPAAPAERDRALLAIMGSPDPYGRQLDGMGGGLSSVSKVVIIDPPSRPDADVDYLFAQVAVDEAVVDYGANCGNMSAAVGPYAVEHGLVATQDGEALVRINQLNTGKIIHARFAVADGKAVTAGDLAIAGVAGTGARIRLDFLDPGGAVTAALLPTGHVVDRVESADFGAIDMTLLDASNAAAFVRATDIGLTGAELPEAIEAIPGLMAKLDRLRRQAGVLMGLADRPEAVGPSNPRLVIVATPAPFQTLSGETVQAAAHDVGVRMLNMGRVHRAIALTTAMGVGIACRIEGTVAQQLTVATGSADEVRVGNPSGVVSVGAEVRRTSDGWVCDSGVVYRTARTLMRGEVAIREG